MSFSLLSGVGKSTRRLRLRRALPFLVPTLLAAAWGLDRGGCLPPCRSQPVGERSVRIVHVVDGDTLVDQCGRPIRVLGLDTPELDTPLGPDARRRAQRWVAEVGGQVTLEICRRQPRDRYSRLLARVLPDAPEPVSDLTMTLLGEGWATPLAIPPCGIGRAKAELAAAHAARRAGRHIWEDAPDMPLAAAAASHLAEDRYVQVEDRIAGVQPGERGMRFILGTRETGIHLHVPWQTWDSIRLTEKNERRAWDGTLVRAEGRLRGRPGQRRQMWLSSPAALLRRPGNAGKSPQP